MYHKLSKKRGIWAMTPRKAQVQISLIPLINIVFLLLIFFLVAGQVEKRDLLEVEVPTAVNGKLLHAGEIIIVLASDGQASVDDILVEFADLEDTIALTLQEKPAAVVTVKADAAMDSKQMIEALQLIKRAGGTHISLVTQTQG